MSPIQLNYVKFMNKKTVVTSKVLIDEAVQSQKKSVTLQAESGRNGGSTAASSSASTITNITEK